MSGVFLELWLLYYFEIESLAELGAHGFALLARTTD